MARFPYQYVNINGIPTLQSRKVTVGTDAVDFMFRPDFDRNPYRGLLLIYLSETIPTGTTTTLPIRFVMAGQTQNVTLPSGDNWTVADAASGVYLVYYDRYANVLQLIQ